MPAILMSSALFAWRPGLSAYDASTPAVREYEAVFQNIQKSNTASQYWLIADAFARFTSILDDAGTLREDWDSYGAAAPDAVTISGARRLLAGLKAAFFVPTTVTASAEGGIAVYFIQGGKTAYIEYQNSGETILAMYGPQGEPEVRELANTEEVACAIGEILRYLAS